MRQVPLIRQPDAFSCGPTCITMVAEAVRAPAPRLSVQQLGALAGTNPRTGTTEVEMARGLSIAGLKWVRGAARNLEDLDLELRSERIVLLRTLVSGSKHWVILEGRTPHGYSIACPTLGRIDWSREETLRNWSARDYDHFLVPAYPQSHVPATRKIHELVLEDFTGRVPIYRPEQINEYQRASVQRALQMVQRRAIDPLQQLPFTYGNWRFYRVPSLEPACRRSSSGLQVNGMLLEHAEHPGVAVGGIHEGVPVMVEDWRGRGGGAAMVLAAYNDSAWKYLQPGSYSVSGYSARCRAHATAVKMALDSGIVVRQQVIDSNPLLLGEALTIPAESRSMSRTPGVTPSPDDELPAFMR